MLWNRIEAKKEKVKLIRLFVFVYEHLVLFTLQKQCLFPETVNGININKKDIPHQLLSVFTHNVHHIDYSA